MKLRQRKNPASERRAVLMKAMRADAAGIPDVAALEAEKAEADQLPEKPMTPEMLQHAVAGQVSPTAGRCKVRKRLGN